MALLEKSALVAAAAAIKALRRVAGARAVSSSCRTQTPSDAGPLDPPSHLIDHQCMCSTQGSPSVSKVNAAALLSAVSREYAVPCVAWHVVSFGRLLWLAGEKGRATLCISGQSVRLHSSECSGVGWSQVTGQRATGGNGPSPRSPCQWGQSRIAHCLANVVPCRLCNPGPADQLRLNNSLSVCVASEK